MNTAIALYASRLNAAWPGLARARATFGLTLREVAEALDSFPNTIWGWEHGRATPGSEMRARLAAFYDVSEEQIVVWLVEAQAHYASVLAPEREATTGAVHGEGDRPGLRVLEVAGRNQ